jgi:16S rRNA G1207 methylase RsmC
MKTFREFIGESKTRYEVVINLHGDNDDIIDELKDYIKSELGYTSETSTESGGLVVFFGSFSKEKEAEKEVKNINKKFNVEVYTLEI